MHFDSYLLCRGTTYDKSIVGNIVLYVVYNLTGYRKRLNDIKY